MLPHCRNRTVYDGCVASTKFSYTPNNGRRGPVLGFAPATRNGIARRYDPEGVSESMRMYMPCMERIRMLMTPTASRSQVNPHSWHRQCRPVGWLRGRHAGQAFDEYDSSKCVSSVFVFSGR